MDNQEIRIKLKSFDHKSLERAAQEILGRVKRETPHVKGPIPLPRRIERFTVNRSPHKDKKSREQFEIRTQYRLIIINFATSEVVKALHDMALPAGIDIDIKVEGVKE